MRDENLLGFNNKGLTSDVSRKHLLLMPREWILLIPHIIVLMSRELAYRPGFLVCSSRAPRLADRASRYLEDKQPASFSFSFSYNQLPTCGCCSIGPFFGVLYKRGGFPEH